MFQTFVPSKNIYETCTRSQSLVCANDVNTLLIKISLLVTNKTLDFFTCSSDETHFFHSYGSTKCGLRQLQSSLFKESKKSKVGVHTASPGMVLTDLLLRYINLYKRINL